MPNLPPVTKVLMLVCVAMFCLQAFLPLELWFALWPISSGRFMPWQPLSYAFLHGDLFHLLFNMLGLWMFGSELERLWGPRRYMLFMAAGIVAAALTQMLLVTVMGSRAYTVGISGGIFALLLAFGMLFPNRTVMLLIPPIPMKAKTFVWVFGALELLLGLGLLNFIFGNGTTDDVAHFAHLGGMLGGFLMIRYWRRQPPFGRRR
ncbi:rhomboid family intramembrane serine protease [Rubrivivax sp. RP6-9]|uniref:rhomboid family intramembrane serine protease n=1 Tax=Rubrivivax sp. RP6-9 TaxID=3415750 RepID=UPI003CC60899